MIEYPIFVPHGQNHLSALVTVPDEPPRALVLLLQGWGAPRSHRYGLWTRTARLLAGRGLASVRMDYPGIGDSTGRLPEMTFRSTPAAEARAVAEVVLDALGLSTLGIAGNCLGARTAALVGAGWDACRSVACILHQTPRAVLQGEGMTAAGRGARQVGRRAPKLRRAVGRFLRARRPEPRIRFLPEVSAILREGSLLFLFLGQEPIGRRLERAVADLGARRGDGSAGRTEVRTVHAEATTEQFRLSLALQPVVIDAVVDWMDRTLPPSPESSAPVPRPAASGVEGPG